MCYTASVKNLGLMRTGPECLLMGCDAEMLDVRKALPSALLALALLLAPARAAEAGELSQSGRVVAQALKQMGFTEGEDEFTPFGVRYGYPHGYWCDMFVSWCADEAGVSEEAFPRSVNCARHCRAFTALGRYRSSAARGGTYTPLQGDLVLFYNSSGRIHHVGLVLYVEDGTLFTVEGNALTARLDYPAEEVSEARIPEIEPGDYVTVNQYRLDDPRLHGYAVPAYASREPLELTGFVDLGRYQGAKEAIEEVVAAGIMKGTSSHTFSPRAGMSRGEFLKTVTDLYGFAGWEEKTAPFYDVPPDHPYYNAVMTARSAGLLPETEENCFYPDRWISGEDAQAVLSALLLYMGLEDRTFSFTPGDLSQILTPYTTRGDIAVALCSLREAAPLTTELFTGLLTLGGNPLDWPARTLDGTCYVPLPLLQESFPELKVYGASGGRTEHDAEMSPGSREGREAAVPSGYEQFSDAKALRQILTLESGGQLRTKGFLWNGTLYVSVEDAARLLHVELAASA